MAHSRKGFGLNGGQSIRRQLGMAVLVLAGLSQASASDRPGASPRVYYEYATVTDVQPIVRVVQISTPREVCWDEPVRHIYTGGGHYRSFTSSVVGGILGGIVGNQFGSGSGQDAMTVAGALLGASIGRDVGVRRRHAAQRSYTTERRCEIEEISHEEERIDGYRVHYRFQGRDYVTRTRAMPGEEIRVRVSVDPA